MTLHDLTWPRIAFFWPFLALYSNVLCSIAKSGLFEHLNFEKQEWKMQIARKPLEWLCDARNISAYDGWNVRWITQPYTSLNLVNIFYCGKKCGFKLTLSVFTLPTSLLKLQPLFDCLCEVADLIQFQVKTKARPDDEIAWKQTYFIVIFVVEINNKGFIFITMKTILMHFSKAILKWLSPMKNIFADYCSFT